MAITSLTGPIAISGGDSSNPDEFAPSSFAWGAIIPDPRSPNLLAQQPTGWLAGSGLVTIDQAPSTIATANIAVLANVVTATPMTLVSVTGAGITVTTAATTIRQTGNVVPSGVLAIDLVPGTVNPSQNGNIQIVDPTKSISRAISITGSTSGTGGTFTVRGYDLYGVALTETITATSGATTSNGKKAFKFITSVTPNFTDAHNYSVGTTDIYGFPIRVDKFPYALMAWNNALIAANTGFTAAVTTTATATTGDVRGTYAVQSASDGTKQLQVFITTSAANISSAVGMIGVAQA